MDIFKKPAKFAVYVVTRPTKRNGLSRPHVSWVGATNDENVIAEIIQRDVDAIRETFGGLMEPGEIRGREYRVFRSEWTEVTKHNRKF
jgi:hypothetical protein